MSRYVDFYLIGELVDSHGNVHYEDLKNLPTADVVERKRGEWIQIEDVDANGNVWYECPFCHKGDFHAVSQIVSYCWNCGADMRGEK